MLQPFIFMCWDTYFYVSISIGAGAYPIGVLSFKLRQDMDA